MSSFAELVDVVRRLRGPDGCPWDREQSAESLRPCLLEEAYEVLDAIDARHPGRLCDELGDLLLQVVMQAQVAADQGEFTIDDVVHAITAKMIRRHPHVFADVVVRDRDEVLRNWVRIKADERAAAGDAAARSVVAGLPPALPALHAGARVGEKASRVGFDWPSARAALGKAREELAELTEAIEHGDAAAVEHELGDALLALASVGRLAETSAELALRGAVARFVRRFRFMEEALEAAGRDVHDVTPAELEALWDAAKAAERPD